MTEKDYWARMEYRICGEFADMQDRSLRRIWCDGITPKSYCITGRRPRVIAEAWICFGLDQELWELTLKLPGRLKSKEEIDWAALFPPPNVTRWLSFDEERRRITIEPCAAIPDVVNIERRET